MTFTGRVNNRGRTDNRPSGTRVVKALSIPKGSGFCTPFPGDILNGPLIPAMSEAALRVLLSLAGAHSDHHGFENGNLIAPYDLFVERGVARKSISGALCDLEALGLIAVSRGQMSYGKARQPNVYRLTWVGTKDGVEPTNEWKAIKTQDDAKARIANARLAMQRRKEAKDSVRARRASSAGPLSQDL